MLLPCLPPWIISFLLTTAVLLSGVLKWLHHHNRWIAQGTRPHPSLKCIEPWMWTEAYAFVNGLCSHDPPLVKQVVGSCKLCWTTKMWPFELVPYWVSSLSQVSCYWQQFPSVISPPPWSMRGEIPHGCMKKKTWWFRSRRWLQRSQLAQRLSLWRSPSITHTSDARKHIKNLPNSIVCMARMCFLYTFISNSFSKEGMRFGHDEALAMSAECCPWSWICCCPAPWAI